MPQLKEYEKLVTETARLSPIIYFSRKSQLWTGRILKTEKHFDDKSYWVVIGKLIKHIKENRQWSARLKKYVYIGEFKAKQAPEKYRF